MALQKVTKTVASWLSPWRSNMKGVAVLSDMVTKGRGCACISPEQSYSRRQTFTEEELSARAHFMAKHFSDATEAEIHHFLVSHQQLVTMGRDKFNSLTELLANHGILARELFIYPNIYRRKVDTVAGRIRQLEDGGVKPITLRMINTTYKKFMCMYGRRMMDAETLESYKNTVELLQQRLGFSEEEAERELQEADWLSNSKLRSLDDKIELFRTYGVTPEAIRDRLWVLAFPTATIQSRLDALKQAGITFHDFPKSYLSAITSDDTKFIKFQEKLKEDKAILAESGSAEKQHYICSRLKVNEDSIKQMVKKFPMLLSVRLPKLKSNFDILLTRFQVPAWVIVEYPRALRLSTATLQQRLQEMQDQGVPVTGTLLSMTNREYQKFMTKNASNTVSVL